MNTTWKTAIGVCAGILAASVITEAVQQQRAQAALQKMQMDIEMSVRAAEAQTKQFALQQKTTAQRQAETTAQQQHAIAQQQENERLASEARENAWKKFYQPTAACSSNWTGACADTFIIAKRAFTEQYKPQ